MSKRKLPNPFQSKVVTADTLAAQTAPDASLRPKKISKKALVFITAGVVLVAGLGVGGYLWWQDSQEKPTVVAPKMPQQKFSDEQLSMYGQYSKLIAERKYDEARALVAKMQISDLEKQAYNKDIDYLASNKSEELQGYLDKQADNTMNYQDASNVGDIYAQRGDTANAQKYYKLAIKLSEDQKNPTRGDFNERVQAKIDAL